MNADTALGVTKRVIVDRGCSFSPLFSLNDWLAVLREGFIALIYCALSVFSHHMLTLQPGDPVSPDDTLVVYRISIFQ